VYGLGCCYNLHPVFRRSLAPVTGAEADLYLLEWSFIDLF